MLEDNFSNQYFLDHTESVQIESDDQDDIDYIDFDVPAEAGNVVAGNSNNNIMSKKPEVF